jgi:hypothetical protein
MDGNETDVREEIATPFLSRLGYERGTPNDILREFSLAYDRVFLGRKKKNDHPLRGRADYVLSVIGAARWVLEVKAPSETISRDVIEQAQSYARHPEVSATYATVLNGRRFVVYHSSQSSNDPPIADVEVTSAEGLAAQMNALLSPSAIRRDCTPPKIDLGTPLADGFRSSAQILRGFISYSDFVWECNFPLPHDQRASLDEMCRKMKGFRSTVIGGKVWRDDTSRIRAKLDWTLPHEKLLKFAYDKKLLDVEYFSLNSSISSDPNYPTIFDVVGQVSIVRGEALFDILRWDSKVAGIEVAMTYRGQASGVIENSNFCGTFQAEYESTFPAIPGLSIAMFGMGNFEVVLDPR